MTECRPILPDFGGSIQGPRTCPVFSRLLHCPAGCGVNLWVYAMFPIDFFIIPFDTKLELEFGKEGG